MDRGGMVDDWLMWNIKVMYKIGLTLKSVYLEYTFLP